MKLAYLALPTAAAIIALAGCGSPMPTTGTTTAPSAPVTTAPIAAPAPVTTTASSAIADNATDVEVCQQWREEQAGTLNETLFSSDFMEEDLIGSTMDQTLANNFNEWWVVVIGHPQAHPLSYYVDTIDAECQSIGQ